MAENLRKCSNCDGVIGRMERAYEWGAHQVCRACRKRLEAMTPLPQSRDTDQAPTATAPGEPAKIAAEAPAQPVPPKETAPVAITETSASDEQTVWKGTPSQVTNLREFIGCGIACIVLWGAAIVIYVYWKDHGPWATIVPLGLVAISLMFVAKAAWCWLLVRHTRYVITTERLRLTTGVFSQTAEEVELYRIKDTVLLQPLLLRLFGLGHIMLITSDKTTPTVMIQAVAGARELREVMRKCIERRRDKKRVREVDLE